MRRETDFVLEQAAWPAMVLEKTGAIRRYNRAALQAFGPLEPSATLTSLWAGESSAVEPFIVDAQGKACPARLRLADNAQGDFIAHISRITREEHPYLVLQLFKETGGQFPDMVIRQSESELKKTSVVEKSEASPPRTPPAEAPFLLENSHWPALLVNRNGMILKANRAAVQAFGTNIEKGGAPFGTLWMPENKQTAYDYLQSSSETPYSVHLRLKTGLASTYSAQSVRSEDTVVVVQFFKTSTETPAAQALPFNAPPPAGFVPTGGAQTEISSAHKQKLECALQLARSVALDFNNALTSILGHTSLLLSRTEANHPFRESLAEIEKSATKAAEIANDLAAFSRQEKESRVQTAGNLNTLLERAMESFKGEHPSITWSLQFDRKLYTSSFDEAKLQQALSKIIENAIQAMKPDGRITLQTRNLELTEPTQDCNAKLSPGNYVVVEVSDTGEGIAPDVLPRIFEPFFTTKGRNHRGLGLAWVYGIVTNHGGAVAVSTKVGVGTSVRVYLPANKKVVRDTKLSNDELRGKETVLFVDDEELLLTMGLMVLSSYGYTVLTAGSGQKALDVLAGSKAKVDVMITDLVMPGMSGHELSERVHALSPQTRIIWASGYPRNQKDQQSENYLQKPFTAQDLLRKVKETMTE